MILTVAVPVPLYKTFDYTANEYEATNFCLEQGCRIVIPFAGRNLIGIIISKKLEQTSEQNYILKPITEALDNTPSIDKKLFALLEWASAYYCHPIGECLHAALPISLRKKTKANTAHLTHTNRWHRTDTPSCKLNRAPKQAEILRIIEQHKSGILEEALKLLDITKQHLKALEKKGLIKPETISKDLSPENTTNFENQTELELNPQQKNAVDSLCRQTNTFRAFLLHGITGSGKTEVYIARVRDTLKRNKQALILIPEINLTPQTFTRFQSQLNTPIGLIHSGMSNKEKLSTWIASKEGTINVIIGTRSAIFTPFQNLDIIIVDEEHDTSYKQTDGFKYSARDLAVKRAQIENCQVVLGSATPSLESLLNANQEKYQLISLSERAGEGQLPDIHLIDIKSRALDNGISRPLINRIRLELNQQNQVIIFQNRRGFSPALICSNCGWLAKCNFCDAKMTLHSKPPHLHCHHCDHKEPILRNCPSCKYSPLKPIGEGTQRLEESLTQTFPSHKVIRIDRDNIKNQHDMKLLVEEINSGEPCILVGTQMLAKGHDFHNVTLAAIIDADSSLFSSDFRACEQITQLLIQVAGRTGRGKKKGSVLIQTRHAEHPIFIPILENNYTKAASFELEERRLCELPPFSKMISIRAESKKQQDNFLALSELKDIIRTELCKQGNLNVSGPLEASISKKANIYRAYLHIFTTTPKLRSHLQLSLPKIISQLKYNTRLYVDVDPLEYT